MKHLKWIVVMGLMSLKAEATVCTAQVIHTMCGTGKMEIMFEDLFSNQGFKLRDGDVQCWGMDRIVIGKTERLPASYPYHLENSYKLIADEPSGGFEGEMLYDPVLKVASLRMSSLIGGRREYNLTCN